MKKLLVALLLVLSFGTANAALFVDIKGQSGSSLVTMTVWGSGNWYHEEFDFGYDVLGYEYDDAIRFDNISGGFAGDAFNNHGSLVDPEDDDWIDISGFTVNTFDENGNPESFEFKRLLIESDSSLDDLAFGTTGDAFYTYKGKSWSIEKTSFVVDLALLGEGAGATFDDLGLGTFTDFPDDNGHGVGQLTLTVSTVPVPAAVWLFGSGIMGLMGFSRFKKS
jgi:hypothetical protein